MFFEENPKKIKKIKFFWKKLQKMLDKWVENMLLWTSSHREGDGNRAVAREKQIKNRIRKK